MRKAKQINRTILGLSLIAVWACGADLKQRDYTGPALAVITGRITAENPNLLLQYGQNLHAALVWSVLPASLDECLTQLPEDVDAAVCLLIDPNAISFKMLAEDTEIELGFPATFKIPLYQPPRQENLMKREAGTMGAADLVIYVDENANQQLDFISWEAVTSPDRVLGIFPGTIIFREGDAPPAWKFFSRCDAARRGFFVVQDESDEYGAACSTNNIDTPMVIELSTEERNEEIVCQVSENSGVTFLDLLPQEPPTTAPPGLEHAVCDETGIEITINRFPERFCTELNTRTYTLLKLIPTETELTPELLDPPAWWPCEVTPLALTEKPTPRHRGLAHDGAMPRRMLFPWVPRLAPRRDQP